MSWDEPPVSGRVNAIKNQFESLKNLEFIDASTNSPKKKQLKKTGFFQRSKTAHDLLSKSDIGKSFSAKLSKKSFVNNKVECVQPQPSNDEPLFVKSKYTKLVDETQNQQKSPSRLSRQTSDPVKRSSIKRSPAFRINNKNNDNARNDTNKENDNKNKFNDNNNNKNINKVTNEEEKIHKEDKAVNTTTEISSENSFPKKFEYFLVRKCATSADFQKLNQPSLTDSIRYALKQPLPTGPPPKKPPRLFTAQNSSDSNSGLEDNISMDSYNQESELIDNKKESNKKVLTKSKTEIGFQGSKLLDCLSCRKSYSSVYDSYTQQQPSVPLFTNHQNNMKRIGYNSIEPVYMEPFSHLKLKPSKNLLKKDKINQNDLGSTSGDSLNENSVGESSCSCPEQHYDLKEDTHYLCTPIDDSMDDNFSLFEKDQKQTLGKTYNEITTLVDAAFQNTTNKESLHLSNKNKDGSFDVRTSISSVRLSRTLTQKRKDYIRRVSDLPESKIKTYNTFHRTFKSPIIKTFSLEENDKNLTNNNNNNKKINSNFDKLYNSQSSDAILSLSDRVDNYKKLIQNCNSENSSLTSSESNKFKLKKNILKSQKDSNLETNQDDEGISDSSTRTDKDEIDSSLLPKSQSMDTLKKTDPNDDNLFEMFMLVGYNINEDSPYIKYKYPAQSHVPENIEQLIFPSKKFIQVDKTNQEYCLILTDSNGIKIYGYCRRILPENSDSCLPLCYCLISRAKALGFYQKLLKEIESRHGQSDSQMNILLKSLQNSKLPKAGKYLHVKLPLTIRPKTLFSSHHKISSKRLSLEANPKWLIESQQQQTKNLNSSSSSSGKNNKFERSTSKQNTDDNDNTFDFSLFNRSLIVRDPKFDEILLRRPNDLRLESTELSDLYINLGPELLVTVFSTLLLERKVILESENLTKLSKSILALKTILYPFQWQYTIITVLPENLTEICQAPFPIIVGSLEQITFEIEDGIIINLDNKYIRQNCGDEQTILPDSLRESLLMSLEMVDLIDKGKMLSAVLISEAFLRFFVELFSNYGKTYFHKEEFIQCHTSQNVKFFLEWFVETSMFRNFCNYKFNKNNCDNKMNDSPLNQQQGDEPHSFYNLFEARLMEKSENKSKTKQNIETIVKNSKIINKKEKSFIEKFKNLIGHHNN